MIPAGMLSLDGERWIPFNNKFLFSIKALSKVFQGKFIDCLKKSFAVGKLTFPGKTVFSLWDRYRSTDAASPPIIGVLEAMIKASRPDILIITGGKLFVCAFVRARMIRCTACHIIVYMTHCITATPGGALPNTFCM